MPMICDDGFEGEMCETCSQTKKESLELSRIIINHFANKQLTEPKIIFTLTVAFLDSLETVAARELQAAAMLIGPALAEWLNFALDSQGSQMVDLKDSDIVANVMNGNNTLN